MMRVTATVDRFGIERAECANGRADGLRVVRAHPLPRGPVAAEAPSRSSDLLHAAPWAQDDTDDPGEE
jgi:hypothetical protein